MLRGTLVLSVLAICVPLLDGWAGDDDLFYTLVIASLFIGAGAALLLLRQQRLSAAIWATALAVLIPTGLLVVGVGLERSGAYALVLALPLVVLSLLGDRRALVIGAALCALSIVGAAVRDQVDPARLVFPSPPPAPSLVTAITILLTVGTLAMFLDQLYLRMRLVISVPQAELEQRVHVEQALRTSEARFQLFMDNSPAASWISDSAGSMQYASGTYYRMFSLPADEVVGKSIFELYPHAIAQQFLDNIHEVVRTGQTLETIELAPRPDGTEGLFLVYKFLLADRTSEPLVGGVALDITERERAEVRLRALTAESIAQTRIAEELRALNAVLEDHVRERTEELVVLNESLRQREQLLRVVVDSLAEGLALVDARGVVILANPALAAICEQSSESLIQRSWKELGLPAGQLVAATLADGVTRTERHQATTPSARRVTLDAQTFALEAPTERQVVVHLVDVTEQVQLERIAIENERLAASGRIAATVAHEVNTPLQAIHNLLYVARQNDLPAVEREATLKVVHEEVDRISEIVRRLLSLHQQGKGLMEPVDCNRVLERVLLLTARTAERLRVTVVRRLSPTPVMVNGRTDQLIQVALNLIVNALDAMPGGGTLTVGSSLQNHDVGAWVVLEVHDTGHGISEAERERIFDEFFTTKREGTGLGLVVSQHIVNAHNGEMAVSSTVGKGSTFTIRLPATGPSTDGVATPQSHGLHVQMLARQPELSEEQPGDDAS